MAAVVQLCASNWLCGRRPVVARALTVPLTRSYRSRRLPVQAVAAPLQFVANDAAPFTVEAPVHRGPAAAHATKKKTHIVVLGSGWGSAGFIKSLDPSIFGPLGDYELTVISPRNFFLYTPLLPAAAGGAVEERSIVEPIRSLLCNKGRYYEAQCLSIDPQRRELVCETESCEVCERRGKRGPDHSHEFRVGYDVLLVAVGAQNATFGIPGVTENCWFLKTVEDAKALRVHLRRGPGAGPRLPAAAAAAGRRGPRPGLPLARKVIEHAGLPQTSHTQRRKMLSVVIAAAELTDLFREDVERLFPHLKANPGAGGEASVTVIALDDLLLNMFSPQTARFATGHLQRNGVHTILGAKVTSIGEEELCVMLKDGTQACVPFGTCIWAGGIAPHPLVAALRDQLPAEEQTARRGLLVLGSGGTIFAIGDNAATAENPREQLPATAQVARQQGEYLATLFNRRMVRAQAVAAHAAAQPGAALSAGDGGNGSDVDAVPASPWSAPRLEVTLPAEAPAFKYCHKGSMAYLGKERGAVDLPGNLPIKSLTGVIAAWIWRAMETAMQVSPRNQVMVLSDFVRTKLFGRNVSGV
eukprot:scaffold7.g3621.t1